MDLFKKCEEICGDTYWKDILDKCSRGKFPRGVRYTPDPPTMNIRGTPFVLPETPNDALSKIKEILGKELSMKSNKDIRFENRMMNEVRDAEQPVINCEWKDIKPKNLRSNFLRDYILNISKQHNLSVKEQSALYNTLTLALHFKQITAEHIHYKNGKITKIEGVKFDKKKKDLIITNTTTKTSYSSKTSSVHPLIKAVNKYIGTL